MIQVNQMIVQRITVCQEKTVWKRESDFTLKGINMHWLMLLLSSAFLMSMVCGQSSVVRWKVHEYPDPFSYDTVIQGHCRRSNISNICDPNGIISKQKADEIDSLISSIRRETRCQCRDCVLYSQGYIIRVALMHRLEPILKLGNDTESFLREAQMFAYMLTQRWSMSGSCNESLLILYSRFDDLLYTLTLPHTRIKLSDDDVQRITLSVRPYFDNEAAIGDGLLEMIRRYRLVFEGQHEEALQPAVSPLHDASGSNALVSSLILTALHLMLSKI